jgi:hypothetical protein
MLLALSGCDPDILLGARPAGDTPDAFSDVVSSADGPISDRAVADVGVTLDSGGMADASVTPDAGAIPDTSVISDTVTIPDRGGIADVGGSERSPDVAPPTILWSADHESGDLSAWHMGGAASGGGQYQSDGQVEASRDRSRGGGGYAAKLTIDTSDRLDHTARLYRRTANGGAYYSAWFFFSQAHAPDEWWSIFIFRAQRDPNDVGTFVNLWNFDIERPDGGNLTLSFYDHLAQRFTRASNAPPIPVGQWTHIEAYFNYAPPDATRITLWLDGQLVFDLAGLGQAPSSNLYWSVGNGSNGLVPRVSSIYIDDAAIATGRLGPRGGG